MHAAGCLKRSPEERYGRFGDGFKRVGALDTPAAALAGAAGATSGSRPPKAGGGARRRSRRAGARPFRCIASLISVIRASASCGTNGTNANSLIIHMIGFL